MRQPTWPSCKATLRLCHQPWPGDGVGGAVGRCVQPRPGGADPGSGDQCPGRSRGRGGATRAASADGCGRRERRRLLRPRHRLPVLARRTGGGAGRPGPGGRPAHHGSDGGGGAGDGWSKAHALAALGHLALLQGDHERSAALRGRASACGWSCAIGVGSATAWRGWPGR